MAAPVQQQSNGGLVVKAGPLVGGVTSYDRVAGRFSLRVGPNRTRNGLSQKIPWFPEPGTPIGDTLVVSGRALSLPRTRSFTQTFPAAQEVGGGRKMFPTTIAPPSAGCWLFTFTTGPTTASIAVLVRPRPTS
ncbi:MAG: hypothetical protein ACJ757_15370 [Gaiellaceae bacterium]